jgi:hypothetical protein
MSQHVYIPPWSSEEYKKIITLVHTRGIPWELLGNYWELMGALWELNNNHWELSGNL